MIKTEKAAYLVRTHDHKVNKRKVYVKKESELSGIQTIPKRSKM